MDDAVVCIDGALQTRTGRREGVAGQRSCECAAEDVTPQPQEQAVKHCRKLNNPARHWHRISLPAYAYFDAI